jgi:thioredoxin reductase (NADPH)
VADFDLIVIGEGMSGLMCASSAAAAGLRVGSFEGSCYGGMALNVGQLEDFEEITSGIDLATRLMEANAAAGVESMASAVSRIDGEVGSFSVHSDLGTRTARAIVLATGGAPAQLGVPGEDRLTYHGVSHCADCDGPIFTNQRVVVVGGGDSAFQAAATLARFARQVTVLVREEQPSASPTRVRKALSDSRVTLTCRSTVTEIVGDDVVTGALVETEGNRMVTECAGIFTYIGQVPNSGLAPAAVTRDSLGYLHTDAQLQTNVPGVFAIGAVRRGFKGQIADAKLEAQRVVAEVVRLGSGR